MKSPPPNRPVPINATECHDLLTNDGSDWKSDEGLTCEVLREMRFDQIEAECEFNWTDWPANYSCCGGCNGGSNGTIDILTDASANDILNHTININQEERL